MKNDSSKKDLLSGCFPIRVIISLLMAAAVCYALSFQFGLLKKPDLGSVAIVVLSSLVSCAMVASFVWIMLFSPVFKELPSLNPSDLPVVSSNSLVCRSKGLFAGEYRIIVDFDADTIHFQHCFTPDGFLTLRQEYWSCPLDDVVKVERYTVKGTPCLRIVTKTGKVPHWAASTNFEELSDFLRERVCAGSGPRKR
jgi:hypothetical protein